MLRRGRRFPDAGAQDRRNGPPGHVLKLGLLTKGSEKTVTLTLGTMPDERQAMQPSKPGRSPKRSAPRIAAPGTISRSISGHPQFEGFEVRQTVGMGKAAVA
jgi:hypothetical protein